MYSRVRNTQESLSGTWLSPECTFCTPTMHSIACFLLLLFVLCFLFYVFVFVFCRKGVVFVFLLLFCCCCFFFGGFLSCFVVGCLVVIFGFFL